MNAVLVDSSVWIEYFRGDNSLVALSKLIENNLACTNELILTELLPAVLRQRERRLAELLKTLRKYPLRIDWAELRSWRSVNLKKGFNNIGIPDLLIAQNCLQNHLQIFSRD
ncbi:MAG: PIN domain-containing protein, partial [Candidatus Margulisbacteria bacterium]|nr:PIN domain-containing protein [Candidatus Margulisiibacteriota bacterium]